MRETQSCLSKWHFFVIYSKYCSWLNKLECLRMPFIWTYHEWKFMRLNQVECNNIQCNIVWNDGMPHIPTFCWRMISPVNVAAINREIFVIFCIYSNVIHSFWNVDFVLLKHDSLAVVNWMEICSLWMIWHQVGMITLATYCVATNGYILFHIRWFARATIILSASKSYV